MKIVSLQSPLPNDLLSYLAGADLVQLPAPLPEREYLKLADAIRTMPDIELRVFNLFEARVPRFANVEFLRHFPFLKRLMIDIFSLDDLSGLDAVDDLEMFSFGATKKAFSLRFLQRFKSLRGLFIERHHKDFESVATLTQLRAIGFRSMTLPNLNILSSFPELLHFELKLGGTADLSGLPAAKKLRYLELWRIRGLSDVGAIGDIASLEALFLQTLTRVTGLPSFGKLRFLRHVYLEQMKGLMDLAPVAEAPALEDFTAVDMRQLTASAFRMFAGHPTLKYFSAGLGSTQLNAEVTALVHLPKQPEPIWPRYSLRNAALG